MKIATLLAALIISFSPVVSYAHKCECGKACTKDCTHCKHTGKDKSCACNAKTEKTEKKKA